MNTSKKVIMCVVFGMSIIWIGTFGFMLLENFSFLEAIYMTVITLCTVGHREVKPLSPRGMVFNIFLILFGVGTMLYIVGTFAQVMIEGQIRNILGRKKLEKKILNLKDHYIVCGYGRMGSIVSQEIKERNKPLVVVEKDENAIASLDAEGYLYILGDATLENVLQQAGIEKAKGLVTVLASDVENVYVTLTARGLNPGLFILARASEIGSDKKLMRAGASKVVSPYYLSGRKMAREILQPTITNFIELVMAQRGESIDLQMEEILVGGESEIVNTTLKDSKIRQDYNLIVIAIKKRSGEMLYNPTFEAKIEAGDTLVALGPGPNLDKLAERLNTHFRS